MAEEEVEGVRLDLQNVADEAGARRAASEDDEEFAVCSECKNINADHYVLNSAFGLAAPCQFCGGGPLIVARLSTINETLFNRLDARRGINQSFPDDDE